MSEPNIIQGKLLAIDGRITESSVTLCLRDYNGKINLFPFYHEYTNNNLPIKGELCIIWRTAQNIPAFIWSDSIGGKYKLGSGDDISSKNFDAATLEHYLLKEPLDCLIDFEQKAHEYIQETFRLESEYWKNHPRNNPIKG